jgi:hypothetical protein
MRKVHPQDARHVGPPPSPPDTVTCVPLECLDQLHARQRRREGLLSGGVSPIL